MSKKQEVWGFPALIVYQISSCSAFFLCSSLPGWLFSPRSWNLASYAISVVHWCRCANLLTLAAAAAAPRTENQQGWLAGREAHNPPENWGHSSGCISSIGRTWSNTRWMVTGVMGKCTPSAPSSRETGENRSVVPTLLRFSLFFFVSVLKWPEEQTRRAL